MVLQECHFFTTASEHGYSRQLEVTDQTSYSPLWKEWVATGKDLKFNYTDPNTREQQSGFWHTQSNIGRKRGERSSVYEKYLLPNLYRPNLKVLRHAYVLKVSISGKTYKFFVIKSTSFL